MKTFQQHLQEAASYHGHICAGQIIGVRMARMALKLLKIDEPADFRDLIVYVECDRCLTDAIGIVTGCKLGRRNLKCMDYGKSAATFLNLQTGESIRIYRKMRTQIPDGVDSAEFFAAIPDEELFSTAHVKVHYRPEDLPGKPLYAMTCPKCGEEVIDGRQVTQNGVAVCRACANGAYYNTEDC
jgi:formylmethanofuran dehydrogenase subunit E